jgi:hypothetical protein
VAGSRSSPDPAPPVAPHPLLGEVRADPLPGQGRSTWALAVAAVGEGRGEDAAALAGFARTEAREAYELYRGWIDALPGAIVALGGDAGRVAAAGEEIAAATGVAGPADADRRWEDFTAATEAAQGLCRADEPEPAIGALETARVTWLAGHDRLHDHICAQFDLAARELGEAWIGELWDRLLGDLYAGRGRMLEDESGPGGAVGTLVLDVAAALRGHLSGAGRDGSVEVVEEAERWRVTIPFCGSGGRTYESREPGSDGPGAPRAGMTTAPHPWAWEAEGVCLYCAHCCRLQQGVPVETLGRPLRVVEPPRWPRDRDKPVCNWYVYKDESAIPASAWEQVGATPPPRSQDEMSLD